MHMSSGSLLQAVDVKKKMLLIIKSMFIYHLCLNSNRVINMRCPE